MEKFNELKIARISRGMSQFDLSVASGVNQGNISRYERGLHSPTLKTIKKLADAMNMELCIEFKEVHDVS